MFRLYLSYTHFLPYSSSMPTSLRNRCPIILRSAGRTSSSKVIMADTGLPGREKTGFPSFIPKTVGPPGLISTLQNTGVQPAPHRARRRWRELCFEQLQRWAWQHFSLSQGRVYFKRRLPPNRRVRDYSLPPFRGASPECGGSFGS